MTSSVEPSTARPLHYFKKRTKILLDLQAHVDKMEVFFGKVARQTNGVLTYYYRIDPSVSDKVDGFWYVDANGNYEVELKYNGRNEVGVLTHAFRTLISHQKTYISDLNELNQALQEDNLSLEAATIRDSLTGVKNRFALRRDYDKYFEKDVHLMMIDIDDFKKVNDNYGHSVRDKADLKDP